MSKPPINPTPSIIRDSGEGALSASLLGNMLAEIGFTAIRKGKNCAVRTGKGVTRQVRGGAFRACNGVHRIGDNFQICLIL